MPSSSTCSISTTTSTTSSSDRNTPDRLPLIPNDHSPSLASDHLQDLAFENFEYGIYDPSNDHDLDNFLNLSGSNMDFTTPQAVATTPFDESWMDMGSSVENHLEVTRYQVSGSGFKSPSVPSISFGTVATCALQISEKEVELVMTFLLKTYTVEGNGHLLISQSSWLLFLLINSPTFYLASLSISAFHSSRSLDGGSEDRALAFRDYREYRTKALQSFGELSENLNSAGTVGEMLICGVHITRLEALSQNPEAYRSHLNSASKYLAKDDGLFLRNTAPTLDAPLTPPSSQDVSHPTPMQSKALKHFTALLLWNDVLSNSIYKNSMSTAETYRKLLSDQAFSRSFQDIIGCESWILSTIMETPLLDAWKRDQESLSQLSIWELVIRSDKIESLLEEGISRLANSIDPPTARSSGSATMSIQIQIYIFAHAILIELHGIVSGPRPNVPDINRSIDRAITAWEMCSSSMTSEALAWPYCVSASLAYGPQRAFFREIGQRSSVDSAPQGRFPELKAVVEDCWREYDRRGTASGTSDDWKEVLQRSNLRVLFW